MFHHLRFGVPLLGLALTNCLDYLSPTARPLLEVSPAWGVIGPGDTIHLSAFLTDSASGPVAANWSSTRPGVAEVDSTGRVRAMSLGTAVVTAQRGARTAQSAITVAPAVLVGAGDIADCALQGDEVTAAIVRSVPGFVFTVGDNAYQTGSVEDFANCYDPSWGQFRTRTRPTPGAHDYVTAGAAGFFEYFRLAAGPSGIGYYSFRVGVWHVVALNTNIEIDDASPQVAWLRADLGANPTLCLGVYGYRPRFSSGRHGGTTSMQAAWEALYDAGAEFVIAGHDHLYERFAPQTPDGTADYATGIRQFTVGTGGGALTNVRALLPNSEKVITGRHGVLKLDLGDSTYQWEFLTAPGGAVADSGTGRCH